MSWGGWLALHLLVSVFALASCPIVKVARSQKRVRKEVL